MKRSLSLSTKPALGSSPPCDVPLISSLYRLQQTLHEVERIKFLMWNFFFLSSNIPIRATDTRFSLRLSSWSALHRPDLQWGEQGHEGPDICCHIEDIFIDIKISEWRIRCTGVGVCVCGGGGGFIISPVAGSCRIHILKKKGHWWNITHWFCICWWQKIQAKCFYANKELVFFVTK